MNPTLSQIVILYQGFKTLSSTLRALGQCEEYDSKNTAEGPALQTHKGAAELTAP